MSRRPVTPARRRRRILRDTLLLAVVLAVLVLRMDFPVFTARQALAATQARYFFGPGEVIAALDNPQEWDAGRFGPSDRYYILRRGDWYACCDISRSGPFWRTGSLGAVENDPSLPLIPLVVDEYSYGSVLVVCNDPDIARVELLFPVSSPETDSGCTLFSASGDQTAEGCFLIPYYIPSGSFLSSDELQVKGYDAAGALRYESPVPERWAGYGISVSGEVG